MSDPAPEPTPKHYSMFGEDLLAAELLGRNGFLVDIGASDGVQFSNSRLLLEDYGWTGLLFEPNPESFRKLKENSQFFRAWCLPFAVSDADKDHVVFNVDVSTPDYSSLVRVDPERRSVPIDVRVISVIHLLKGLPPVDLLLIDTEGNDTTILQAMLSGSAWPNCIIVEAQTEVELDMQVMLLEPVYGKMVQRFTVDNPTKSRAPCNTMWRR